MPSVSLRAANSGSTVQRFAYASTISTADRVGSVDSSRRCFAQPPPRFCSSHQTACTMTPRRFGPLVRTGAADEVTQASQPTAIAANAVVRCRQPPNRLGIELGAIQPRTPAPAGCTRWRQLEQGRIAPDLTDNGVTALHRRPDHRAPHVPGIEQQTQGAKTIANRPQQGLGQGNLPGMTDAAAQAGQDRNG